MKMKSWAIVPVLLCLAVGARALDPETVKAGREIMDKYQEAIIGVSGVLKIQYPGSGERDQKIETVGAIIDPSGLMVVSLATVDPVSMYPKRSQDQIKSKLSDLKIRLADNTEVPAKLVLKDPDLDLGFIMPDKSSPDAPKKYTWIKLDKDSKAGILDEIILLSRLPKSLNRKSSVDLGYVNAIIDKPRKLYCYEAVGMASIGIPAFLQNGKVLGICLVRKSPSMEGGGGSTIILPSEDVMEIADQVLKKEEKE